MKNNILLIVSIGAAGLIVSGISTILVEPYSILIEKIGKCLLLMCAGASVAMLCQKGSKIHFAFIAAILQVLSAILVDHRFPALVFFASLLEAIAIYVLVKAMSTTSEQLNK